MELFESGNVNVDALKKKAFNYRWAEVEEGVIPLTAADPDYPCAPEIRQSMIDYINDGYFSYAPKTGYESLKEGIAQALMARKQEEIPAELILPVDSAARGMYIIARAFLKPGDEMIVFDPCDYLFRESALAAGAKPVMFPARLRDGKIDLSELESYITPKTRMIGLCNPHNPYGKVYNIEDLDFIMKLCEKHDLMIMNDEIWSDIIYYDAKFTSIYALGNERCRRVFSVFGFSKSFGLAGLRIGCVYGVDEERFENIIESSDVISTAGGAASISQVAAETCVTKCYYWVDEFLRHLEKNRDYAVERINRMPGLKAYKPQATYLLYVDVREFGMTSEAFTEYLKSTVHLALIPGGEKFFGAESEGYIRICIATSFDILKEGLDRLETGVKQLNENAGC